MKDHEIQKYILHGHLLYLLNLAMEISTEMIHPDNAIHMPSDISRSPFNPIQIKFTEISSSSDTSALGINPYTFRIEFEPPRGEDRHPILQSDSLLFSFSNKIGIYWSKENRAYFTNDIQEDFQNTQKFRYLQVRGIPVAVLRSEWESSFYSKEISSLWKASTRSTYFQEKMNEKQSISQMRDLLSIHKASESQKKIILSLLTSLERLQVLKGPPGAGKTQVFSLLCLLLHKLRFRALLPSYSNQAVDKAQLRCLKLEIPTVRLVNINSPKVDERLKHTLWNNLNRNQFSSWNSRSGNGITHMAYTHVVFSTLGYLHTWS